jgi:amino acid adenylation domain-containing protein
MLDKSDGNSLRSGFLRHAKLNPNAPAVVVRGVTRSYGELEVTASRWANAIITAHGYLPERVGVFAYRSEASYAGTLAALFAGATFVPLNPTFPPEKTAAMISQADLDAIIVDTTCMPQLAAVLSSPINLCVIIPESEASEIPQVEARIVDKRELDRTLPLEQLPPLSLESTAYLLFTSGSTGVPKGVPVTHGNATYFIELMSRRYGIRPDDRFSQTFDQTFDLSVFDIFLAWRNGACVYSMASVDLLSPTKFINHHRLTVWFSVPSVPAHMCRRKTLLPDSLPTLRWSLFCGEPLVQRSAEAWQQAAPNSTLENLYGPTELTIACFAHRWDPVNSPALCRNGVVPIGRPYEGLMALVVDDELNPVEEGETGELCVGGPQTTPGYWRAPDITAERFVNLTVSKHEMRRFYRTGDLVAKLPEGDYVFLGRTDQQIKVVGHRVELGEIEAVLRSAPGVEYAVAFGWPVSAMSAESVVAFVCGNSPNTDVLMSLAKSALPPYMVPGRIFVVTEMPLNANGKVDRRALKERLMADGKHDQEDNLTLQQGAEEQARG